MSDGYDVPAGRRRRETVVRRSRFVATLDRVQSERDVRRLLDEVKSEFPDATHHVYAYVIGPPGSRARAGSSDAGEPRGTAGRPVLDVLLGSGLGDAAVVVSRWFGGTKLGTGGLKDAYAEAARAVLEGAERGVRRDVSTLEVRCPWAHADAVRRAVRRRGASVIDERFGEGVVLIVEAPVEAAEGIEDDVLGLTRGSGRVRALAKGDGG